MLSFSKTLRRLLWPLFAVHCALRLAGLGWNLELHAARPAANVPTYHVDEYLLIEGLRSDYRLFSDYSIVTDGPLSLNLTYVPLRVLGERPPESWHPARALLVGRWLSALSECLAFPLLWGLLLRLGVGEGAALLGVAVLAFAPNHVFNAHFARSHALAGLLQLLTWYAAARALGAPAARARWSWFGLSALASILAGATRYPFLTLGVFPAATAAILLVRARRAGELGEAWPQFAAASLVALGAGLAVGFDLRPLDILRAGFLAQQAVGQIPWTDPGAIVRSALAKLVSTLSFPGGGVRFVMLVATLALPLHRGIPREREGTGRLLVPLVVGWAFLYLALWAKFGVPWQRYSMPFSLALTVSGAYGLDRLARATAGKVPRGSRTACAAACALLLASPAYMSVLVTWRFVADRTNPHYRLALELERLRPRSVYVSSFWSWNRPVLADLVPASTALVFVPNARAACEGAAPDDVIVDFSTAPLGGKCPGRATAPAFHFTNLGPPGYPFPAGSSSAGWAERHWDDYHYLFEDVRGWTIR